MESKERLQVGTPRYMAPEIVSKTELLSLNGGVKEKRDLRVKKHNPSQNPVTL